MIPAVDLNAGDWIGIVGIIVGLAGVGLGVDGRKRAKDAIGAAEAADKARAETQRELARAILLIRTGDLEAIESRLRRESQAEDRVGAEVAIDDWLRVAPEYQGLVAAAEVVDDALSGHLELSLGLVELVLEEIASGIVLPDACRELLHEMRLASARGRSTATGMMVGGSDHES